MQASKHQNEAARLAALRSYDILDTPRESDFDDIVDLAADICGTAISVINLIDADRQWFKAETGLGVRETPLETSICAHVILQDEFVEIFDTRADPRMCDNPLCLDEPGLRFYAGALLRTRDGQPIGTLCVLDHQPRTLTDLQRQAIRVLAAQVMTNSIFALRSPDKVFCAARSITASRIRCNRSTASSGARTDDCAWRRGEGCLAARRTTDRHSGFAPRTIRASARFGKRRARSLSRARDDLLRQIDSAVDPLCRNFDAVVAIPEEAAVLGTIVNELVTNAVKHSLRQGGTVSVRGEVWNEDGYRLTCENAIGVTHLSTAKARVRARAGDHRRVGTPASRQRQNQRDGDHYLTEIDCRLSPVARANATGSALAAES